MCIDDLADLVPALAELLSQVESRTGAGFSGVGVIVSENPEILPIFPLRETSTLAMSEPTVVALSQISTLKNEYHDGFHVLSPDLRISRVAQYFSPPIKHDLLIDRRRRFGGRYLAALFGSALPGALVTGIASRDFGVAVFQHGVERFYRKGS